MPSVGLRRRGAGGLGLLLRLLFGLLGVLLVGALLGGGLRLALAPGGAVVGVVEARALEVHGHGMEDPLDRRLARRARRNRGVGHALRDLEDVPVVALVLVDGHPA